MLTIHEQQWRGIKRYLIFNEQGSVMLDIFETPKRGIKALIWALWVLPEHRGKGLGTALMNTAEELARREELKSVTLTWHPDESADEVREWYLRRGYEKEFVLIDDTVLMKLIL